MAGAQDSQNELLYMGAGMGGCKTAAEEDTRLKKIPTEVCGLSGKGRYSTTVPFLLVQDTFPFPHSPPHKDRKIKRGRGKYKENRKMGVTEIMTST